jgi:hypothetical protein
MGVHRQAWFVKVCTGFIWESGRFREKKILLPLLLMGFVEIFEREFVFGVVNIYVYLHVRHK